MTQSLPLATICNVTNPAVGNVLSEELKSHLCLQNRVVKPEPSLQPKQELQAAEQIDCASGKAEDDADVAVASEENAIGQEVNKEGQGDENDAEEGEESESAKADREWARHLAMDNSVIYDVFSGQLQSSIKCHKCNKRFTK